MSVHSIGFLIAGAILFALGALVGAFFERRRFEPIAQQQLGQMKDLARQAKEAEFRLTEVQSENKALSSFLVVLPDLVRRFNSRMPRRSIPPLLAGTIEQIFEPAQILVYLAKGKDELVLACGKGIADTPGAPGRNISFGQGRIGIVAHHQMAMVRDDIHAESAYRRAQPETTDPVGLVPDLIAPMVHDGETLGVISVGGVGRRHRDEKRMIKLVADLGAMALNNFERFNRWESMANADSLTQLATKRHLSIQLGHLMHRAEVTHEPLSLIIFDIDHFKKFNDTYGHLAGDGILKAVASILKDQLRRDDLPARYGGEEFVVVLPNTAKEDAVRIAEKIRSAIERCPFRPGGGADKTVAVTMSGGVAAHMVDGTTSNEILGAADQALYLAKERGRNRIVEYRGRYLSDEEGEAAIA